MPTAAKLTHVWKRDVRIRDTEIAIRRDIHNVSGDGVTTYRPELSAWGDELVYSVEEGEDPVFILSTYRAERRGLNRWSSPWRPRVPSTFRGRSPRSVWSGVHRS